jgi:hypothetical protein
MEKRKPGRPPSEDPRVRVSFRLSGPVARALGTFPLGNRSAVVDAALRAWLTERVYNREEFEHLSPKLLRRSHA